MMKIGYVMLGFALDWAWLYFGSWVNKVMVYVNVSFGFR
jgi:hypothetical protein